MNEIDDIKRERFERLQRDEVIMIVKSDYGYRIEQWSPGGVYPQSDYDTAQEAGARALQLLKLTEPVTPQSWPEIAQIGGERSPPPHPKPDWCQGADAICHHPACSCVRPDALREG